ncbi:MAG: maltose ABC transporter permease MalF [Betaproteobacteria bacterium]
MMRAVLRWALTAAATLGLLWMVFGLYAGGRAAWAASLLAFGSLAIWIYASSRTLAAKYLFPGVAGMLVFIALPLVYTVQIGFTNYSSAHLLEEDRARAYLLAQTEVEEAGLRPYTLHRQGAGLVLALGSQEGNTEGGKRSLVSPTLSLSGGQPPAAPVAMQAGAAPAGEPLSLREVVQLRPTLQALQLQLPDGEGGAVLSYTGLRDFGPVKPLWQAQADGSLKQLSTATVFHPNRDTGYFETAQGERMLPGFKVGIGLGNYTRMLGDADFRGPFVSIFIWTVMFSALTVLFATAIGLSLAVVLNWEALPHRTLYRTLLFLPYAVPGFISILVFKGLFNQNFGEINAILDALFGVRPAWFADPLLAKVMILTVNTWLGYPYIMVLCTGLIKAIPADLYEASAIAGATPWQNFRRITAPLILKPLTPLLISAFAFNFNNFVLISLLTDGRPDFLNTKLPAGTTDILVSYTYRIAFTDSGQNFGLAAAISTLIFAMVALMSLAQLRVMGRGEDRR